MKRYCYNCASILNETTGEISGLCGKCRDEMKNYIPPTGSESSAPTLRERIKKGECVSPLTAEKCPVCIDHCEASDHRPVSGSVPEKSDPPKKPLAVKPNLYAYYMEALKQIAIDHGYNLVVHGSMNRDLDLIAIPWVNEPKSEFDLMSALHAHLNHRDDLIKEQFLFNVLPGGRHGYVINLNRGGYRNYGHGVSDNESLGYEPDQQYYIDISVTPLVNQQQHEQ